MTHTTTTISARVATLVAQRDAAALRRIATETARPDVVHDAASGIEQADRGVALSAQQRWALDAIGRIDLDQPRALDAAEQAERAERAAAAAAAAAMRDDIDAPGFRWGDEDRAEFPDGTSCNHGNGRRR